MATTTSFTYQSSSIAAESINGTASRSYTIASGATVKMTVPSGSGAGTYVVTWNGHGDASALSLVAGDGSLALANSFDYSTWGTPATTVASGSVDLGFRFLYVGSGDVQWDNDFGLGLEYMHARNYAPAVGRFVQPDPARADANHYAYAADSPINQSDPSGLWAYLHYYHKVHEVSGDQGVAGWIFSMGVGAVASGLVCYWTTTPLGGVLCSVAFVAVASRVPGEPAATSYVPGYDNRYIEDLWAVEIGSGPRAVAVTTYKIVHQLRMADGWHTVVNGIGYRVKAAPSGRAEQAKECQEFKTYGVRGKLELLNPCDFRAGWYPNV